MQGDIKPLSSDDFWRIEGDKDILGKVRFEEIGDIGPDQTIWIEIESVGLPVELKKERKSAVDTLPDISILAYFEVSDPSDLTTILNNYYNGNKDSIHHWSFIIVTSPNQKHAWI